MISYLPWSKKVLEECLLAQQKGQIPALDFEFSAKCTYANCIYCDSKPVVGLAKDGEVTYEEIAKVLEEAKQYGLRWMYSCGLGEPLEDVKFDKTIEKANSLGIQTSIFSNGIAIDSLEKAKWLHENNVSIILKLDTFKEATFDKILGIKGAAAKVYQALDYLLQAGYGKKLDGNHTRLAFSIVPTSLNIDDIEDVFKFAIQHNVFPSIGELEQAGVAFSAKRFGELDIGEKIKNLKSRMDELWGGSYCRPMCPVILTGLHINHLGDCTVDSETGLNCKWFMLKESKMEKIASIRDSLVYEIFRKVKENKEDLFRKNSEVIEEQGKVHHLFGGCGGSPRNIINMAKMQCNQTCSACNTRDGCCE